MSYVTVECQCDEDCNIEFEVPEQLVDEAEFFEDILVSEECPYTDFENAPIIHKLKGFVRIATSAVPG